MVSVENSIKPASRDLFIGLESGVVSHTQKHIADTLQRLIRFAQRLSLEKRVVTLAQHDGLPNG